MLICSQTSNDVIKSGSFETLMTLWNGNVAHEVSAEAVCRLVDVAEVQGDREVDERTSGLILSSVRIEVDVSDRINHSVT